MKNTECIEPDNDMLPEYNFDYSKSKPNRFAELKIDEFRKISLSTKSTKKSCIVRVFRVFRGQKNKHE